MPFRSEQEAQGAPSNLTELFLRLCTAMAGPRRSRRQAFLFLHLNCKTFYTAAQTRDVNLAFGTKNASFNWGTGLLAENQVLALLSTTTFSCCLIQLNAFLRTWRLCGTHHQNVAGSPSTHVVRDTTEGGAWGDLRRQSHLLCCCLACYVHRYLGSGLPSCVSVVANLEVRNIPRSGVGWGYGHRSSENVGKKRSSSFIAFP